MQELVGTVSLAAGARGVRALFTSKPSEKEVQRTKRVGSLAVRALTAVLCAPTATFVPMKTTCERLLDRCAGTPPGGRTRAPV